MLPRNIAINWLIIGMVVVALVVFLYLAIF
jgi:hypothetical protein